MEEDRNSSATVVLPDISETSGIPTANEEELEARGQGVRVTGGNVVTVPVSVPVLSGVASNGATFNVITQDSLQLQGTEFKPVLCVDNRFVPLRVLDLFVRRVQLGVELDVSRASNTLAGHDSRFCPIFNCFYFLCILINLIG